MAHLQFGINLFPHQWQDVSRIEELGFDSAWTGGVCAGCGAEDSMKVLPKLERAAKETRNDIDATSA